MSCLTDGIGERTLQNSAKTGRHETPEQLYKEFLSTITDDSNYTADGNQDDNNRVRNFQRPLASRRQSQKRSFQPYEKRNKTIKSKTIKCYNCKPTAQNLGLNVMNANYLDTLK